MKKKKIKNNKGFTLVEVMFAILILTFAISSLMGVVANGLFSAKYSRDEITATYLAQEIVDYIRNDRDTTVFLQESLTTDDAWNTFVNRYSACSDGDCYIDPSKTIGPVSCSDSSCTLYYDDQASAGTFYNNNSSNVATSFKREIIVDQNPSDPNELNITVTVSWQNGSITRSRSLSTSLLKWQQ